MVLGKHPDSDVAEIDSITRQRGQNTVAKQTRAKDALLIMPYGQARIPVHTTAF